MAERIGSSRDAASTLFNLPGYRAIARRGEAIRRAVGRPGN